MLANPGIALIRPKVDAAENLVVRKPDRPMVIVVGRSGMPHPCQRQPRWAYQRKKERARRVLSRMPAQPFVAIDDESDLVVRKGNDLETR